MQGLKDLHGLQNGTPTAYDCCFGPVNQILFEKIGIDSDSEMLKKYFTEIAKEIDHFDDLNPSKTSCSKECRDHRGSDKQNNNTT